MPLRPVVKAALRRVWRDPTTLQIGVHPDRAVVLGGVAGRTAALVAALDGTRDETALRATASSLGLDPASADRLIALLADACVLDDAGASADPLATMTHEERDRLAPDLASVSIASGELDAGASTMRRRQAAAVGVIGGGRVGGTVATLLAAAGVGRVVADDDLVCRPGDCAPGAASVADAGATRAQAVHAAVHRASGSVRTSALAHQERFDIVVLAPAAALNPQLHEELLRAGIAHLLATVREVTGVVGPFVVPGASACLRCLDLHRTDRDRSWPLIAAQLATDTRRPRTDACDVVLATLTASVAALQVLSWLDLPDRATPRSQGGPATFDATLELTLPDWRIRRRRWLPHPACGCHWPDPGQ